MDITNASKEQKSSAAVAYLSQNTDKAPASAIKALEKLSVINNEGMGLVKQIQEMKAQIETLDNEIGQKIGGAKALFEIIADQLTEDQVDEFAGLFDLKTVQPIPGSSKGTVDIAGATAPKSTIVIPGGVEK